MPLFIMFWKPCGLQQHKVRQFRSHRSSSECEEVGGVTSANAVKQDSPPVIEKNAAAVALGRLGGLKGGKARSDSLTPEKRKEIAQKAAAKRWAKK